MKIRSVRYLTGEGFKNVWVNRLMSLASIGVLVACMVVIGLAILISANIDLAIGNLEKQNVVIVYMKDYSWALYGKSGTDDITAANTEDSANESTSGEDSNDEDAEGGEAADENGIKPSDYIIHDEEGAKELCAKIEEIDNVLKVEFISSEDGLLTTVEHMMEGNPEVMQIFDEEYGNPMSMGAKVTMESMEKFDETVEEIKTLDGIDTVRSQKDLANKIEALKKGISIAGIWIIALLMIISLIIVSNTIRVTMYNRKLEISIMKAVGATNSFIRIPFIVEGVVIGLISAILSEAVVYFCYRVATETIITKLATSGVVPFSKAALPLFGVFAGIGVLAGALGSFIIIGKYLRREGSEFAAI